MKGGNLVILTPGFRRVLQFRVSHRSFYMLMATLLASIGFAVGISCNLPRQVSDTEVHRLVEENSALSTENKNFEFQVRKLNARAATLEQIKSRVVTDLQAQLSAH